jgi:flavin-dependent dehydrogenase
MNRIANAYDVVIGGSGIAAAASALRLCALGLRPLVLATSCEILPGIEAVPESVLPLFRELGAEHVLEKAGATLVHGFDNHWDADAPVRRTGWWIHVDRQRLATTALREAKKRGTVLLLRRSLPRLHQEPDATLVRCEGMPFAFASAIDATGRSAVWSRPIRRRGNQIADMYSSASGTRPAPARVLRHLDSWAYRIGTPDRTTFAIVSAHGRKRTPPSLSLPLSLQKALGLPSDGCVFAGRRPAFPQWCDSPVEGRRLAVGDAALAHDPIAGQGIRFAISSAFAASSVINTWRTSPSQSGAAERFYDRFVERCRLSHLRFVDQMREYPTWAPRESLPKVVAFSASIVASELQLDSTIQKGEAILLPEGGHVRWVGGLDLLRLRDLLPHPIPAAELASRLVPGFCDATRFPALLRWCLRHQVLGPPVS